MTTTAALQLLGSGFLLWVAVIGCYVALNSRRFGAFGRDTLLCISLLVASIVVIRMLALGGWLSQKDARTWNGLIGGLYLVVLVQIVYLHRTWHKIVGDQQ